MKIKYNMSINGHKTGIQDVKERKEKNITNSLHPSKSIHTPYKYKTTLNPKVLPLFFTNDKGQVTERSSSRHHWKS